MPWTMFDATRPLSGFASPARYAESNVKKAHPMQISRLVRTPAGCRFASRSSPITPPSTHAVSRRVNAPFATIICCSQLKLRDWISSAGALLMAIPCPMLSPLRSFVDIQGIGDVNRRCRLLGEGETLHQLQALGMRLHCAVYVVAVEGENHCGVLRGRSQRVCVKRSVALVDRLSQRDACPRHNLWKDGGLHQHRSARAFR